MSLEYNEQTRELVYKISIEDLTDDEKYYLIRDAMESIENKQQMQDITSLTTHLVALFQENPGANKTLTKCNPPAPDFLTKLDTEIKAAIAFLQENTSTPAQENESQSFIDGLDRARALYEEHLNHTTKTPYNITQAI